MSCPVLGLKGDIEGGRECLRGVCFGAAEQQVSGMRQERLFLETALPLFGL
jgi:hypothetical protein